MSVYDHPSKIGWQMIKISHGRQRPAEYIPFHGSREDALILEAEIRGTVNRDDPGFADLLPEYKVAYKNRSSLRGYQVLENSFKHLVDYFGQFRMRHITPSLIENYKAKRLADGVTKRTINIELSGLSGYITWLNETAGRNYTRPKRFGKRETKPPMPHPLSVGEIVGVLEHLRGDIKTMVALMAFCGLRRDEVFSLTRASFDQESRTLTVLGKGNRWRRVPISVPSLADEVAAASEKKHPSGLLFPSPKTGRKYRDIKKSILQAASKAGIAKHVHPHLLRHSFATALVNSGVDIRIIQELLGHSELATTEIYTHIADTSKRLATDVLASSVALVANKKNEQKQNYD